MTERSIFSGNTPQVIIRAGGNVTVKGYEGDRVQAGTSGPWGLQLKRKKQVIEVQVGGNGQVRVPFDSSITVYAGGDADIQSIQGKASAFAGRDLNLSEVNILDQASAGGKMNIDCQGVARPEMKLTAGWHLRCWIRSLPDARYVIDDLGGKWQALFGDGSTTIRLKAGGDVQIIAEGQPTYDPPDGPYGTVERPQAS